VEDEAWGRLDPAQRRQRTLDAVKRLLLDDNYICASCCLRKECYQGTRLRLAQFLTRGALSTCVR